MSQTTNDTTPTEADGLTAAAQSRILSFIERVERLDEDAAAVAEDRKQVFAEARGEGFDVRALRAVIKLRGSDKTQRQEQEALVDLYSSAIGGV